MLPGQAKPRPVLGTVAGVSALRALALVRPCADFTELSQRPYTTQHNGGQQPSRNQNHVRLRVTCCFDRGKNSRDHEQCQRDAGVKLEACNDKEAGFLRITVTKKSIVGEYYTIDFNNNPKGVSDSFTIGL